MKVMRQTPLSVTLLVAGITVAVFGFVFPHLHLSFLVPGYVFSSLGLVAVTSGMRLRKATECNISAENHAFWKKYNLSLVLSRISSSAAVICLIAAVFIGEKGLDLGEKYVPWTSIVCAGCVFLVLVILIGVWRARLIKSNTNR